MNVDTTVTPLGANRLVPKRAFCASDHHWGLTRASDVQAIWQESCWDISSYAADSCHTTPRRPPKRSFSYPGLAWGGLGTQRTDSIRLTGKTAKPKLLNRSRQPTSITWCRKPFAISSLNLARKHHITWCQKCLFSRFQDVMFATVSGGFLGVLICRGTSHHVMDASCCKRLANSRACWATADKGVTNGGA